MADVRLDWDDIALFNDEVLVKRKSAVKTRVGQVAKQGYLIQAFAIFDSFLDSVLFSKVDGLKTKENEKILSGFERAVLHKSQRKRGLILANILRELQIISSKQYSQIKAFKEERNRVVHYFDEQYPYLSMFEIYTNTKNHNNKKEAFFYSVWNVDYFVELLSDAYSEKYHVDMFNYYDSTTAEKAYDCFEPILLRYAEEERIKLHSILDVGFQIIDGLPSLEDARKKIS